MLTCCQLCCAYRDGVGGVPFRTYYQILPKYNYDLDSNLIMMLFDFLYLQSCMWEINKLIFKLKLNWDWSCLRSEVIHNLLTANGGLQFNVKASKEKYFFMLALLRWTIFWPPSMVYISVVITNITDYNSCLDLVCNFSGTAFYTCPFFDLWVLLHVVLSGNSPNDPALLRVHYSLSFVQCLYAFNIPYH